MSCCCANPYKASCGNICDGFTIDFIAPLAATYTLVAEYFGGQIQIQAEVLAGDKPVFDLSQLNPFVIYTFYVFVDGVQVAFVDSDLVEYQCFELRPRPYGSAFVTIALDILS
jgi:hypothetical protein